MINKLFKRSKKKSTLELEIERLENELNGKRLDSKEYDDILRKIDSLVKLEDQKKNGDKLTKDTKVQVATYLGGICLILLFERSDIIRSKAVSFVQKIRIN